MPLTSQRVVFFNNDGQAAVKYNFDGRTGPVTYIGPNGNTIGTVADYSATPNLTEVVFYASGAVQQYTTNHADGSSLTLLFADTTGGKPSVNFGLNNDLSHGELLSSIYFSPRSTGPSSPTPFRVYQTFSNGHLTLYDVTTQDSAHVGLNATFSPTTLSSQVTLTTIASTTPITVTGSGPIDALIKLQAASLISQDGGGIVSHDAGGFSLIGQDGGGLVASGAGNLSLISASGTLASIVSHDAGGLIGQDGGGLISQDGGGLLNLLNVSALIGQDGGGLIATNAGALVSSGGGNLVASGAGNLVASGAGNLVASGAGNLALLTGTQLLAADAARLISQDGGGLFGSAGFASAPVRFAAPIEEGAASTLSAYALQWTGSRGPASDGSAAVIEPVDGEARVALDGSEAPTVGPGAAPAAAPAASADADALNSPGGTLLDAYLANTAAQSIFDLSAHFSSGVASLGAVFNAATASPDLKISASYLDRASADAGGTISVTWQVQNAGAGPAAISTSNVILSRNAVLGDGDDVVIGHLADPALGSGRAISDALSVQLPSNLTPGSYYIGVVANGTGVVAENATNNLSRAMVISVPSAGTALTADLTVSAAYLDKITAKAGSVVNVAYQIKNAGTATAGVSHSQIYLHAADGSTPDVILATTIDPALLSLNAVSNTVNVTMPANLAAGTYYLTVIADGQGEVSEAHEANNASVPLAVAITLPTRHEVLFASSDSTNGAQLWSTDGTASGTRLFKNLVSGFSYIRPSQMAPLADGRYIMVAASDLNHTGLWITDGTAAGTTLVKSGLENGGAGLAPTSLTPIGGTRAVFLGQDAAHGQELWVTDGTAAGTQLVTDINPGASASGIANLKALGGGKALFTTAMGKALWITDGTATGTQQLIAGGDGFPPSSVTPLGGGKAIFSVSDGTRNHIYVTDGTVAGTTSIYDGADGAHPELLTNWVSFTPVGGGLAVFQGTAQGSGAELWVSDGTRSGTRLLADLSPSQTTRNGVTSYSSSAPQNILSVGGGKAFVPAHDVPGDASHSTGSDTYQLFYVDAVAGTGRLVTRIGPDTGSGPSVTGIALPPVAGQAFGAGLGDGRVIFAADDGIHGVEPWVSDGTAAGTRLIKDLNAAAYTGAGSSSSYASDFQFVGAGQVMFRASSDGGASTNLWITDGTAAGTYRVGPDSAASSPLGDVAVFNLPVAGATPPMSRMPTLSAGAASNALVEPNAVTPGVPGATVQLTAAETDGSAAPAYVTTGLTALSGGLYRVAGTYGDFILNVATGQVVYTLDAAAAAGRTLAPGATATDSHVFSVSDGVATASATATFTVTGAALVASNTPPVLGGAIADLSAVLPGSTVLQPRLTIIDPDAGAGAASARIAIVGGYVAGDQLTVTAPAGVAASYDSGAGVLTLTGAASDAAYQAALRTVAFSHDGAVAPGARTVVFSLVDDRGATSNVATEVVNAVGDTAPAPGSTPVTTTTSTPPTPPELPPLTPVTPPTTPVTPPPTPVTPPTPVISLPSQQAGYDTQVGNMVRAAPGDPALTDPTSPLYAQIQAEKAIAAQLDAGLISTGYAQLALLHLVDGTTSVAEISYAFFTGRTPTAAGLNYLVHSTANATDLNDAYYAQFSTENRYINFAANLARFGDATTEAFHAAYDGLSLRDATAKAYQAVFGSAANSEKIDALLNTLVPDGLGGTETRAQYLASYGGDGPNGIGTKAALIGWLLGDSVKEGFGTYQQADFNFLQDLAHGTPAYNVDLLAAYGRLPSLVGQPVVDTALGG